MSSSDEQHPPLRQCVVAVIERGDKYLVIRRSEHVIAPLRLCFPGGGIEPGESESVALRREVEEELGVAVHPVEKIWECVNRWRVHIAWWRATLRDSAQLVPNPDEVAEVLWMSLDEMHASDELLESNHDFLKHLAAAR